MTSIDTSYYLSNNQTEARKTGDKLGKDDFLNLLMTQLKNQDPSNPMDNTQFISQMATFSSLEQMVNIGKQLDKLIETNTKNSIVSGSELIGKQVTWKDADDQEVSAIVKSVLMKNGQVQFEVNDANRTKLTADQLIGITSV